jgi:hypothetical protein
MVEVGVAWGGGKVLGNLCDPDGQTREPTGIRRLFEAARVSSVSKVRCSET